MRDILASSVTAPVKRLFGNNGKRKGTTEEPHIWALKDVSFEVKRGEVVGIIGRNGAGKSTLLKILSRITRPTSGYVEINGRVGSLLEVGTGFHPELTGRENIYLNGAVLGMRKAEIKKKFDEIVAFAEVEKFLDTPVKRYSSGMYVRLAFAVAAHLEPETLLIDEVLAVGDTDFQKKCLGKMGEVAKRGRTILFVSHNISAVNRLCRRCFWIDAGLIRMDSNTQKVASCYLTDGSGRDAIRVWTNGIANRDVSELKIYSISVHNSHSDITNKIEVGEPFEIRINYEILERLPFCRLGIRITTIQGITVFETYDADHDSFAGVRRPGRYLGKCTIPGNLLSPSRYVLSINAGIPNVKNLAFIDNTIFLDIEDTGSVGSSMHGKRDGIIRPMLDWEVRVIK
ncbi:MAG: ABC transporter ATP-binding protein [Desulforhabdus sp.]|nr:ABC transporter ATP-binding protein [Desulforhabdus sp.]